MDLSETIIAAMIGAGATVATATFQLFMAFRSRKADSKPKRGSGMRSTLAVFGLVLGAAVAGFAYSELRVERERENTMAMERRISDRLQALANGQLAQAGQLAQFRNGNGANEPALLTAAGGSHSPARSEAMVHIAACRSQTPAYGNDVAGCDTASANRVALCASMPSQAGVLEVQLFARVAGASPGWEQSRVSVDQEVGGASFVGSTYEVEQGADQKAVCAVFSQWNSERGHEARLVVVYTTGPAIAVPTVPVPADAGNRSLPALTADIGSGGTVGADSGTPGIISPDPAPAAAQAAIAAQP